MSWSLREVPGGAIELFEPSTPQPAVGLLFLPGHSGKTLAASAAWTSSLEHTGLRAACPVSGSGWWLDAADPTTTMESKRWDEIAIAMREGDAK